MPHKTKTVRTLAEVGRCFGVSTRTAEKWPTYADFPARLANGAFSVSQLHAFCKRHGFGPYNASRSQKSKEQRLDLLEARRRHIIEQGDRLALKNARNRAALQREVDKILLVDDVRDLHRQLRAIAVAIFDEWGRQTLELLETPCAEGEWPELRERAMKLAEGLPKRLYERVKSDLK